MKRGSVDHPKMLRLAKLLGIARWGAVGLLESLIHFTARHAIQGNVGRWSDEEIAYALAWDDDPARLVDALVKAGFLERHPAYRLLVHDWHQHADDSVRKTLRNNDLPFLTIPEESRPIPEKSGNGKPKPSLALPEPKPEPEPGPVDSSEPQAAAEPMTEWTFPVHGQGPKNWTMPKQLYDVLAKAYPGLSIEAQMRKVQAWLAANPGKHKTARGMPKFLNAWLERSQNNGTAGQRAGPSVQAAEESMDDFLARVRKDQAEQRERESLAFTERLKQALGPGGDHATNEHATR